MAQRGHATRDSRDDLVTQFRSQCCAIFPAYVGMNRNTLHGRDSRRYVTRIRGDIPFPSTPPRPARLDGGRAGRNVTGMRSPISYPFHGQFLRSSSTMNTGGCSKPNSHHQPTCGTS